MIIKEDVEWDMKNVVLGEDEVFVSFKKNDAEREQLRIQCKRRTSDVGETDCLIWGGCLAMCDFFVENETFFRQVPRIIELGCGVGLFGALFMNLIGLPERPLLTDLKINGFCENNCPEVEKRDFDWKGNQCSCDLLLYLASLRWSN